MKPRSLALILVLTVLLAAGLVPAAASQSGEPALIQITLRSPGDLDKVEQIGVPVYARLTGERRPVLLAGATAAELEALQAQSLDATVLDEDTRGASYYVAYPRPDQRQLDWSAYGQVLMADSVQTVLRTSPQDVERMVEAGAEVQAITFDPKPLRPATTEGAFPTVIDPDPMIQMIIDQVSTTTVYSYTGNLSGEWPVDIGGVPYTITTRNTYSGEPIEKATIYAGNHLADLGLSVEYHQWGSSTYPNVIGELPGMINPDDIFIIGGHIDDMPSSGPAPGADDNASGSVATLIAADILTQYQWGCTLRFALWTGEEQGLLGSQVYAQRAYNSGENIVGYLNLDMIAWNTPSSSPDIDLHADSSLPATLDLAQLFADVVAAYNLNLIPQINPNGSGASDHASFWQYGYTSILGIEDFADFNPRYHTSGDLLQYLEMAYYTDFVKASIATFAHMSDCLIPGGLGYLDGHVTDAAGGAPIEGAQLEITDDLGHTFHATTDPSGYYTRTLVAGTYTVTADAYGYLPSTVSSVVIYTDTVTTVDLALDSAPTYVVSGTVTQQGTGTPLLAEVEFLDTPVTVTTDPATGFYQATLPQGSYTMRASAAGHRPQERPIVVDQDQTQDFALELLPCILLVDDDAGEGYQTYYENAIVAAGQAYDLWTVTAAGSPSATDLAQYSIVIWLTGDDWSTTLTSDDQAALATYLDAGGRLFVSGQDIGYDIGTTPFYASYLHAAYDSDDTNNYTLTGLDYLSGLNLVIQGGDGANNQDYPSDVSPIGGGVAVMDYPSPHLYGGVAYQDGTYGVVYLAFGFEAIDNPVDRTEVMSQTISWLGGCACDPVHNAGFTWTPRAPVVGETVVFTGTAEGDLPMVFTWSFSDGGTGWGDTVTHTYSLEGEYPAVMTATNVCGHQVISQTVIVRSAPCEPVDVLTVTADVTGCVAGFEATLLGSEPFAHTWDFGSFGTYTVSTPTVTFGISGTHAYTLTVWNCGGVFSDTITDTVTVTCEPREHRIYLPLVLREG